MTEPIRIPAEEYMKEGYENVYVYVLGGGVEAWKNASYPMIAH